MPLPAGYPFGLIGRLDPVLRSAARLTGSFPVHFHLMLYLLSFMRLFVVGLTSAVLSMLASPWCTLLSLSACSVQLLGLLVASLNLTISLIICSTGFLFSGAFILGFRSGSGSAS